MQRAAALLLALSLTSCASYDDAARGYAKFYNTIAIGPGETGTPVYAAEQCIGAIVNGVCHGSIMPNGTPPQRCHGEMINGQCTGPMF